MTALALALAAFLLALAPDRSGRTSTGIMYEVHGSGPAVVLITGSNLDRRMWAAEVSWLKERHTVVCYDLRAHGQSDDARAPFSHVGDLFAVLDTLGIHKAALVGLSAGSTIALDAALHAPERITALVLAAPAISGFTPRERPAFFAPLVAALQQRDYAAAAEVMLASPLLDVPDRSRALVRQMVTENHRLWAVPRGLMQGADRPAAQRLEEVRAPTLVVVGDRDLAAQREQAGVLGERIPGARMVIIPGGGHMLNLTSVERFRQLVSEFLDRRSGPLR
jgi:3-oxoadipate enol-lactonase